MQVLIASPADVGEGRLAIQRAIHAWNALNAVAMKVVLLPVRWESHTYPALGDRPQAIVNSQIVRDCDMLVGALWTRLGSPTGVAASGTVEEIEQFEQAQRPVMVYFSNQPVIPDQFNADEYAALVEFRTELRRRGLDASYDTVTDLEQKVVSDLTRSIRNMAKDGRLVSDDVGDASATPSMTTALEEYRLDLLRAVTEFDARWKAGVTSDNPDVEQLRWNMFRLGEQLVELAAQVAVYVGSSDAAVVNDLQLLSQNAHGLGNYPFYLDGGRSFDAFRSAGQLLFRNLREVANENWSDYIVTHVAASEG